jgi:hypothetical protein
MKEVCCCGPQEEASAKEEEGVRIWEMSLPVT